MNTSASIGQQEKLSQLRQLLESIEDEAVAPLLEVVRVGHPDCTRLAKEYGQPGGVSYVHPSYLSHCFETEVAEEGCHGTGYVLRDWTGLPEGALAGALILALRRSFVVNLECKAEEIADLLGLGYESDNDVFLDAVLEAVRDMKVTS